jgi:hypothetical protein
MGILQQREPSLAEYVAALDYPEELRVVESANGLPTLKAVTGSGQSGFLHSPEDPASEAKRQLHGFSFKSEDGTILFGLGLGYLAKEIVRAKEQNHILFVTEGLGGLFKLAMTHMDLSDVLSDDKVFFFVGDSVSDIMDGFLPIQGKAIGGTINKLAIPSIRELCMECYDDIDRRINEHIISLQIGFNTFNALKDIALGNLFRNIPAFVNSSSINSLCNLMEKKPAVVVAAGPSLTGELGTLKEKAEDFLVISVDAALIPLVKNDIWPDIVVTCDPQAVNFKKVSSFSQESLASMPLVYQSDATPEVVQHFGGKKFVVDGHTSISNWLVNSGRTVSAFPFLQTVSHLGFLLARHMGADPIILVGLDLSFPYDKDHAEGCADTWHVDFEKSEFQWVPSTNGGRVKSIEAFVSMIHVFEREIRRTSAQCINVSQDGALIGGTESMPLEEALNLECVNDRSSSYIRFDDLLGKAFEVDSAHLKESYKKALMWMVSEVEQLSVICQNATHLLNKVSCVSNGKEERRGSWDQLLLAYKAVGVHMDVLDILTDYLAGFMIASEKKPKQEPEGSGSLLFRADRERIPIFFEELGIVLPALKEHCIQALAKL